MSAVILVSYNYQEVSDLKDLCRNQNSLFILPIKNNQNKEQHSQSVISDIPWIRSIYKTTQIILDPIEEEIRIPTIPFEILIQYGRKHII